MRKVALSAAALAGLVAVSACGESPASQDAPVSQDIPVEAETEVALTFAELTGDAVSGERVFMQCQACHRLEEGSNAVGPSLYGVIGKQAGGAAGFNYSQANANAGFTWTPEIMFEYLESPREYLPGNRMAFAGLKDAQDRADLIAFLEANGE